MLEMLRMTDCQFPCAGQAVVQIAEQVYSRDEFAIKFFLSPEAFAEEASLYEDPSQPLGRFLPELHAIVAADRGGLCLWTSTATHCRHAL
ncbi:MAG: hypothetical protein HC767_06390 [Akkermansiaceae bacterium]|nr:hypothetical protein [Akkermansiaceae bacterium]